MHIKSPWTTLACGLAAGLLMSSTASAVTLKWTLVNAVFDDGGVATGSFDYNTVTEAYTDIDVVTTAGSAEPGYTFTTFDPATTLFATMVSGPTSRATPRSALRCSTSTRRPTSTRQARFRSARPGGSSRRREPALTTGCTLYNPVRSLSGSVFSSAVPEPGTWAFMLLGVGGAGLLLRRTGKVQAATA